MTLKIAIAQINATVGDLAGNADFAARFAAALKDVWARGSRAVMADYIAAKA